MKRQIIISVAIAVMALTASARRLSPQEALMRAERTAERSAQFNPQSVTTPTQTPRLVHTESEEDAPTVYVFDRPGDGGYLVVSADDASGPALLGYSDSGSFPAGEMPENVKWWLGQYSREIASIGNNVNGTEDNEFNIPYVAPIEPICKTQWSQLDPYNEYCPAINGTKCPTGCVATAMAQAMKVYNWPEKGKGSHTYRPGSITEFLTVNFADSTYRWDKMLNGYSSGSPKESRDAVASLMYSCGVAINMQYHPNSAGGNYTNAARALVNYFDYDKSLRIIGREYYGIAEWFDMIIAELQAGHPVLYSGKNDESGHAFVCDGYKENGYFHINWGWAGGSDGYFLLTALNPQEQGVGGSAGGYNLDQQIVIGLKRPEAGSTIVPVMQLVSNFTASTPAVVRTAGSVKMGDRRGIFNQSIGNIHATMGVKLTDESGNVSYIESTTPDKKYVPGQGFMYYYVPTASFPQTGVYTVEPAVKDSVGNWFDCEVKLANDRALKLRATADSLVFSPGKDPVAVATEVEMLSPIYPGKQCGIRARVTNNSDLEFYEEVLPVLVQDHTDMADGTPIAIELLPGESRIFEWVGEFPSSVEPGDYLLYLVDSNNKDLNSGLAVTVEVAPTADLKVEVTSTDMAGTISTEQSPCEIPYDDFKVAVHIKCEEGYFSGMVDGGIWPLNATAETLALDGDYLAVREGEEGVVEINRDVTDILKENVVYYFMASTTPTGRTGNKLYFTYSTSAGIDPIAGDGEELTVSHDPGSDMVTIKAPADIEGVDLYNISGSKMLSVGAAGGREVSINIGEHCGSGICLVVVRMSGRVAQGVRVII